MELKPAGSVCFTPAAAAVWAVASDTWQWAQREPGARQSHQEGPEGAPRHFLPESDRHPEEGTLWNKKKIRRT